MKPMIPVSAFILFMLFILSKALASNNITNDYCSDNSTLVHVTKIDVSETNTTRTFLIPVLCHYGCDSERNVCNGSDVTKIITIISILVGLFILTKFILIPMVK